MNRIMYWGKLADVTGCANEQRPLPETVTDTQSLRAWIDDLHKADGAFLDPVNRIAVNDEIVIEPADVHAGDDIAFLPPIGGG